MRSTAKPYRGELPRVAGVGSTSTIQMRAAPPFRSCCVLESPLDDHILAKARQRIDRLLCDPKGFPNGKNKRTKLNKDCVQALTSALIDAFGHASVWAAAGPLSNRVRRRGRPPDNATFVFIDDIVCACERAGLKPGLRYVEGSESFPVRVLLELAPLLWGSTKAPRKLFARWQHLRPTLVRE
jgi:hypothetical protein